MSNKGKLVRGVGVNDADYPVNITAVIGGRRKALWECRFYRAWVGMLERCYSAKFHDRCPTYIGCSVTPEWHSFSAFRAWMVAQDWEGNHLDKDILHPGNKIYAPDTCVFVSHQLNMFMTDRGAARGEWPIGVHWNRRVGKFVAQCRNPFTGASEYLSLFTCPAEAHEAWRARKHEHACVYADMQTDPRIAKALRARYAQGESL